MIKKVIAIAVSGLLATTITTYGFSMNFHRGFALNRAMSKVRVSMDFKVPSPVFIKLNNDTTTGAAIDFIKACSIGITTSGAISIDANNDDSETTTYPAIGMFKIFYKGPAISGTTTTEAGIDMQNINLKTIPCIKLKKEFDKKFHDKKVKKLKGKHKGAAKHNENADNNKDYNNNENNQNTDNSKITVYENNQKHHKQSHARGNKHSHDSNNNNND